MLSVFSALQICRVELNLNLVCKKERGEEIGLLTHFPITRSEEVGLGAV